MAIRKLGNWDKISLNFKPYTPLTYTKKRKKHLVFIEIKPEVTVCEDIYFTDCNATRTRNSQRRGKSIEGLHYVHFDIINGPSEPQNQNWQKYVQAEILVPHHIPISMFKAIHFISNASKEYGELLWGKRCDLFCVNPETFYDINRYGRGSIQFPYVREVLISTKEIPEEKVYAIRTNDDYVIEGKLFWVIVHFHPVIGTRVTISIKAIKQRKEFHVKESKKKGAILWRGFTAPKGLRGLDVKVYIDEILWSHRTIRCMKR